jgi:sec-independent protein translocase protein TatA
MSTVLGPQELLIVLIIVLVLFGGAKLPKLARSLGQAQREFREGVSDEDKAAGDSSSSDSKPEDA